MDAVQLTTKKNNFEEKKNKLLLRHTVSDQTFNTNINKSNRIKKKALVCIHCES